MWTYEKALVLVKQWVRVATDDEGVVQEEMTITRPYGWIFSYNSRLFVETGNDDHCFLGNAPIIFDNVDGEIRLTGTAYPIEHYLAEYEKTLPPARLSVDLGSTD